MRVEFWGHMSLREGGPYVAQTTLFGRGLPGVLASSSPVWGGAVLASIEAFGV